MCRRYLATLSCSSTVLMTSDITFLQMLRHHLFLQPQGTKTEYPIHQTIFPLRVRNGLGTRLGVEGPPTHGLCTTRHNPPSIILVSFPDPPRKNRERVWQHVWQRRSQEEFNQLHNHVCTVQNSRITTGS